MTFKEIRAYYAELVHASIQKLNSVHGSENPVEMHEAMLEYSFLREKVNQLRRLFDIKPMSEFIAVIWDDSDPRILAASALIESWKE